MAESLRDLADEYETFVDERDWDQYHTPQNLAMAISVESNELLEEFLWFNNPDSEEVRDDEELVERVQDELADVLIYSIGMANQLDIDPVTAVEQKMEANEERFDEDTATEIQQRLDRWQ